VIVVLVCFWVDEKFSLWSQRELSLPKVTTRELHIDDVGRISHVESTLLLYAHTFKMILLGYYYFFVIQFIMWKWRFLYIEKNYPFVMKYVPLWSLGESKAW
jgi:hypothetical protein